MKIYLLIALLVPSLAFADSHEDKIVEALQGSVRKADRPFTIFHWERIDTEFSKKFKLDDSQGLVSMTQAASRSFLEQDAKKGFYAATDPVASRAFGYGNWRLIQMEVPEGWKYLDIGAGSDVYERLSAALPEDAPCLNSMLVSNNHKGSGGFDPSAVSTGKCTALKQKVFKRLGVSGVKYMWVPHTLGKYCRGTDRSAFIITNGSWLSAKNVKAYTVDSREEGPDRKAIQELVLTMNPPWMYRKTKPAPLWKDLPQEPGLADSTKEWMNQKLFNCREMKVEGEPEAGDDSPDEEKTTAPAE
ncbi:MAG: hypothetical protein ACXWQO_19140 [Bdellovibrionota bacterium]